jgi:O-antigen/teichoic acid export membrane protein
MKLRESVLKLFSGGMTVVLIEFVAVVGFTQLLGAAAVGSFFVFRAVVGMLGIPVDLGISRATEKHLSADEPPGEVIGTATAVKFLLFLPWVVALLSVQGHVERYVGVEGVVPFVIVGLLADQARKLSLRVLAGQLRVEQNALLRVVGKLVWVIAGMSLVLVGWEATAIIAAFVVGQVATVAGALVRMDLTFAWPRVRRARELVDFGRYILIGSVGGFIYQWMDVAILRLFVPVELVGAYEIAWRVASVSMMLTNAIRTSLFPQISQWHAQDEFEKIEDAFYTWLQVPLYLTIPAFAGAVVLGEVGLRVLFGAEVTVAYAVLVVFMVEKIVRSVQMVVGPSLFAMDQPQLGYRESVAAIAVNLVLNITLIPEFGMIGAAVATSLGALTGTVVSVTYVTRFVTIRVPFARIAWSTVSAALMAGVVFAVRPLLSPDWQRLVAGVTVGAVVYGFLLLANDQIRLELRGVLSDVAGAVP